MPSVGDIVRVVSCKTLFTEDVCNVFYYAVAAWTGNLSIEDLLADLQSAEVAAMSPVQATALLYDRMRWENLTTPAEVAEYINPSPDPGLVGGDFAPSFVAFSAQLVRTDLSTRHGYKRIGGVPEINMSMQENDLTVGEKAPIETFLGTTFTSVQNDELDPVIVGRTPAGLPDLARINPVLSVIIQDNMTTQNTRKAGRGS